MMVGAISSGIGTMALSILTSRQSAISNTTNSMAKLATGLRIINAGHDPSGLAQSERMRSQISRYEAALSNIDNALSYSRTGDSYLQNIHDVTGRMSELAIAANDGTLSDTDRAALQAEFSQLQNSLGSIAGGESPLATYNGNPIFAGEPTTLAIGPDSGQIMTIGGNNLTPESTEIIGQLNGTDVMWSNIAGTDGSQINISTQANAALAAGSLNLATSFVSGIRANLGAEMSRLQETKMATSQAQTNVLTTESRIRDVDVAKEMISFNKYMTLGKLGTNALTSLIATA